MINVGVVKSGHSLEVIIHVLQCNILPYLLHSIIIHTVHVMGVVDLILIHVETTKL